MVIEFGLCALAGVQGDHNRVCVSAAISPDSRDGFQRTLLRVSALSRKSGPVVAPSSQLAGHM